MKKNILLAGLLSLLLFSCEKPIDFELKDEGQKLVVEATIENGQAPW
jgi:hypothetical protein